MSQQIADSTNKLVEVAKSLKEVPEKVISGELSGESLVQWLVLLIKDYLIPFGVKILLAVLAYFVGRWVVRKLKKIVAKMLAVRQTESSLSSFILSLLSILLNFILVVTIISILGIDTTSLVALLASAGLAIGMALSGTLQNFAGGVMILLFKPFKVGDFIEGQGQMGTVKEIQIFNTVLNTVDNKMIIIPNGGLSTSIMTNFSREETRRVDWEFSIAYGDDYDKAKAVLKQLCEADSRILKDPEVFIELIKLNSSSVDIVVRAWVHSPDYWSVFFSLNEKVYKTFAQEGLNIPFPQMDVHLIEKI